MTDWEKVEHMPKHEWRKDPNKVHPQLVYSTDRVRGVLGVPYYIHVAWDDAGHEDGSYHYGEVAQAQDGHFADEGQTHLQELLAILSDPDIGGVGFYPGWNPRPGWHMDVRDDVPRVFWVRQNGKYIYGIDALAKAIKKVEG